MKGFLLVVACLAASCGGDTNESEPPFIRTGESCSVDGDCKKDPSRVFCRDEKTAVRYEIATCDVDKQCAWGRLEAHCDVRCEDGYCLTAAEP